MPFSLWVCCFFLISLQLLGPFSCIYTKFSFCLGRLFSPLAHFHFATWCNILEEGRLMALLWWFSSFIFSLQLTSVCVLPSSLPDIDFLIFISALWRAGSDLLSLPPSLSHSLTCYLPQTETLVFCRGSTFIHIMLSVWLHSRWQTPAAL